MKLIDKWQKWDVGGWQSRKPLWPLYAIAMFSLVSVLLLPSRAQNGTPHGITAMWNAPSPVGGSGTVQGYDLFQCIGTVTTCTLTTGAWTAVAVSLPSSVLTGNNCSGFTNCYLVPAASLSVNTSYMYAVSTIDSNGNQSSWDLTTTPAVVGSTFPANPASPSGAKAVVQ